MREGTSLAVCPLMRDDFYHVVLNVVHYIICNNRSSIWEEGGPGVRDGNKKLKWGITSKIMAH